LTRVVTNAKSNLRSILLNIADAGTLEAEKKVLQVMDESLSDPEVIFDV
jgi:hypothetical protein